MNTDEKKNDAKYTLISYRPNGSRYEGCGDYVRFDSELDLAADLSEDELKLKIVEKISHADSCCGSCPASETEIEFALLKDGKPIYARGDNLYSFSPAEETEDTLDADRIFAEAHDLIRKDKEEKATAALKAKEEATAKAAEQAKKAAEAARVAAEVAERKRFEELKAKFEPKAIEPAEVAVEKAKEQAKKLVAEAVA